MLCENLFTILSNKKKIEEKKEDINKLQAKMYSITAVQRFLSLTLFQQFFKFIYRSIRIIRLLPQTNISPRHNTIQQV